MASLWKMPVAMEISSASVEGFLLQQEGNDWILVVPLLMMHFAIHFLKMGVD